MQTLTYLTAQFLLRQELKYKCEECTDIRVDTDICVRARLHTVGKGTRVALRQMHTKYCHLKDSLYQRFQSSKKKG